MSQIVLALLGFAAVLIVFVHPVMVGPAATPAKVQMAIVFLAALTGILAHLLRLTRMMPRIESSDDPVIRDENERLALICSFLC